ncbi:MAG: endolytic transglycosylase MltG [Bacteroidales bacterium]|nr:endolytic transglycosylase MltG [Bacteroidales bacterium]
MRKFLAKHRRPLLITTGMLVAAAAFSAYSLLSSLSSAPDAQRIFVDADDDADSVRTKVLAHASWHGSLGFRLATTFMPGGLRVPAGAYDIGSGQSPMAVVRRLRAGRQTPVRLTIPSVWTMNDLAGRLSRFMLTDSATWAAHFADSTWCARFDCTPQTLPALYLTNTYEVYWTEGPDELTRRMQRESKAYWNEQRTALAQAQGLTPTEVIVLASIVDRETAADSEKPMVAGMYLGRLRKGMKLQADPTVKFALGQFGLRRLLHAHLTAPSPYNTYVNEGLPPGPIALPSRSSIEAVLHPAVHDYLYMCANDDFSGTHRFARTYEEHLQNAARYARALDARQIK